PDDLPGMLAKVTGPLERGEPHEVECRFRRHDGVYRWVVSNAVPVRDAMGAVIKWIGTTMDIDDTRRLQVALQESEEKYRFVAETLPCLVWSCLPDGYNDYF